MVMTDPIADFLTRIRNANMVMHEKVDAEKNLLLVKGSVPGPNKSMITIKSAVKAK